MSSLAALTSQLRLGPAASGTQDQADEGRAPASQVVGETTDSLVAAKPLRPLTNMTVRPPSLGSSRDTFSAREGEALLEFSLQLKYARCQSTYLRTTRISGGSRVMMAPEYLAKAGPALEAECRCLMALYTTTSSLAVEFLDFKPKAPLVSLRAPLRALLHTLATEYAASVRDSEKLMQNYDALEGVADYVEAKWDEARPLVVRRMPFAGGRVVVARDDAEANGLVAFMNACVDAVEKVRDTLEQLPLDEAQAHAESLLRHACP